jgi:hypothetical protein
MTAPARDPDLVVRLHAAGGVRSEAVYSGCGRYRYALTRFWDAAAPRIAFVMLNPSTASELADDPTVARCVRRARDGGWGAVRVCNLFALRETLPARLRAHATPEGPGNGAALAAACRWADAVAAAWGVNGAHLGRGPEAARLLRREAASLLHLGLTRAGHPRHPLYVSYRVALTPWEE